MSDHDLMDIFPSGFQFFMCRCAGDIDFHRAFVQTAESRPRASILDSVDDARLVPVCRRLSSLVGEYQETARRVGAPFRKSQLLRVVHALLLESFGHQDPTILFIGEEPIPRFLAESLFGEILELSLQEIGSPKQSAAPWLSPEEWRVCLDILTNTILVQYPALPYAN